jgi:hypothetical protein
MTEWVYYRDQITAKDDRDELQHTHDLARNVWLALVVVLVVLFNLEWPG